MDSVNRRDFLRTVITVAGSAAIPAIATPNQISTNPLTWTRNNTPLIKGDPWSINFFPDSPLDIPFHSLPSYAKDVHHRTLHEALKATEGQDYYGYTLNNRMQPEGNVSHHLRNFKLTIPAINERDPRPYFTCELYPIDNAEGQALVNLLKSDIVLFCPHGVTTIEALPTARAVTFIYGEALSQKELDDLRAQVDLALQERNDYPVVTNYPVHWSRMPVYAIEAVCHNYRIIRVEAIASSLFPEKP